MTTESTPLHIEVGEPTGVQISPDMWGLFIEDLNDALDGGLNAELVRNGDFEFSVADHAGWGPLTGWRSEGAGSVEVRTEDPVHPANGTYLRLTGPVTVTNEGFDGVGLGVGDRLRLTFVSWVVSGYSVDGPRGEVRCAVVGPQAELAAAVVRPAAGGWTWNEVDLVADAAGRGELRIDVPAGLTLEIDVVSLRPVGADGAALTFRPDLLEALRDLHPSFIRFPGGCIAHGLGLGNMYHWKTSIGPRHEREQTFNLWGYHQSRQIGYLEYFELCEATGATPLPVVAAGVCCQNLRGRAAAIPEADMPAYITDVCDLIEFANGGPETVWGARRVELGHPEPFGMRYLGLGNEDEITDDFRSRYAAIADAVAAAHPEITIIGTVGPQPFGEDFEKGWVFARERGVAMVDEHAYRTPRWFHQNLDRYDAYSRQESGVYFGEYAARTNRVRSALAEAAFMIAMERNADVVRLASYAPLLARVGHTQWTPDLIYFDADRVLPSASYFVQQAFGAHRGVDVRQVTVTGAEPLPVALPATGSVRLRSPGAEMTFTDILLDGVAHPTVDTAPEGAATTLAAISPAGAELSFTALRTAGTEGWVIELGPAADSGESYLEVVLGGWQNKSTMIQRWDDGISNEVDGPTGWSGAATGEPVRVRVRLDGPRVQVWVDDEPRHDYVQDLRPEHRVVAGAASRLVTDGGAETIEHVIRMVNATAQERATRVSLAGKGRVSGTLTLLAGAGPDDGEPFEASPVTPVVGDVSGEGGIDVVLPPWSFAVAVLR